MSPWWSRPTADGGEDGKSESSGGEGGAGPRSGRRGRRGRNGAPQEANEPASLISVVSEAAEASDRETASNRAAGPETSPETSSEGEGSRRRSGRSRSRRGRSSNGNGGSTTGGDTEPRPATATARSAASPGPVESATGSSGRRSKSRRDDSVEFSAEGGSVKVPDTDVSREIVISIPDLRPSNDAERKLALFCDLENVARGAKDTGKTFDIGIVLERLLEKGKVIVRKAYCDWSRYADYKRPFHEAGIELIEIPQKHYSGKNSADIRMVVDAMDLSYSKEHLDTFVLLSGDSDFSPLVSKLKENNKYVIAVGVKGSTSKILIDACDEFIYYEDIWRDAEAGPKLDEMTDKQQEMVTLLVDSMKALIRENKDVLWGSMIKQTMQRKRPSFNESYYGYSTFSEMLEACEAMGVVELKRDKRSGSYIVTALGGGKAGGRR